MKRSLIIVLLMIFSLVVGGGSSAVFAATVEVRADRTLPLKGVAKAVVISPKNKMIFVLAEDGQVNIYADSGMFRGSIKVSSSATDIAVSEDGANLYVIEGENKVLRVLALDYIVNLKTANSPFMKGPPDAPVTIVEFGDFQCPYCARLNPLLKQVLAKYPAQVKLVYKFFPLISMHKFAMRAAIAAQAAGKQGKFWEYHDGLLASYNDLSEARLVEIGEKVGLDMNRFAREQKDPRFVNVVRKDIREARENQVTSVPTIYVNGRKLGRRTLDNFDRLIRDELKRLGNQK